MAKVAEDYFGRSARKTETFLGWNRKSIQLGLHERRTDLLCADNYRARGRHKSEQVLPNLEVDIRSHTFFIPYLGQRYIPRNGFNLRKVF